MTSCIKATYLLWTVKLWKTQHEWSRTTLHIWTAVTHRSLCFPKRGKWCNLFILSYLACIFTFTKWHSCLWPTGMDSHAYQSSPAQLGGVVLPGAQDCSGWRQLVDLRLSSQRGVSVDLLSLPLHCSDFCWWHCIVPCTGVEACKSVRVRDPEERNSNLCLFILEIFTWHMVFLTARNKRLCKPLRQKICVQCACRIIIFISPTSVIIEHWSHLLGFQNTLQASINYKDSRQQNIIAMLSRRISKHAVEDCGMVFVTRFSCTVIYL